MTHTVLLLACSFNPSLHPSLISLSPPSLPLSSFIPACIPPSFADLHCAALINTPLRLPTRLLNVKTGNQRVMFHLECKSKVPGLFSAPVPQGRPALGRQVQRKEQHGETQCGVEKVQDDSSTEHSQRVPGTFKRGGFWGRWWCYGCFTNLTISFSSTYITRLHVEEFM